MVVGTNKKGMAFVGFFFKKINNIIFKMDINSYILKINKNNIYLFRESTYSLLHILRVSILILKK